MGHTFRVRNVLISNHECVVKTSEPDRDLFSGIILENTNAELNETSFAAQAATTRLIRANAAADNWHEDFNTLSRFVLSNNPELFRDAFRVPSQRDSSTQPDIVQGAPSSLGANSATPDAIVPLTSQ
ncbi:hypothetical protein U1Q18_048296 [Sarracenia purpurea var. burkii]